MSVKLRVFQQANMAERAFHQRARIALVREGELCAQCRIDGAVVHPHADGDAARLRRLRHLAHLVGVAQVAGIQAEFIHPLLDGGQGEAIVEVDIRHQRDVDLRFDGAQRVGGARIRHRHAHQFAAGFFQRMNLRHGGRHIVRGGFRHRLHGNRARRHRWSTPRPAPLWCRAVAGGKHASSHLYLPPARPLPDVFDGDECHQTEQNQHADHMHHGFFLRIDPPPEEAHYAVNNQKEEPAAVQRRDGQQIEKADEVRR